MFRDLGLAEYVIPDHADKCFDHEVAGMYLKAQLEDDALTETVRIINLALFFRNLSSDECSQIMRKMTFDNHSRETVCKILQYKEAELPQTRAQIKHILKYTGADIFRYILEFRKLQGTETAKVSEEFADIIASGEAYNISMLAVNGRDLIEAGLPAGPALGAALSKLLDAVIEDPALNTCESLLKLI